MTTLLEVFNGWRSSDVGRGLGFGAVGPEGDEAGLPYWGAYVRPSKASALTGMQAVEGGGAASVDASAAVAGLAGVAASSTLSAAPRASESDAASAGASLLYPTGAAFEGASGLGVSALQSFTEASTSMSSARITPDPARGAFVDWFRHAAMGESDTSLAAQLAQLGSGGVLSTPTSFNLDPTHPSAGASLAAPLLTPGVHQ